MLVPLWARSIWIKLDWHSRRDQVFTSRLSELAGTEVVDGQETTIIAVNDLSGFDFAPPAQGGIQGPMQARSMRLFVDTDDWVIRRMELTIVVLPPPANETGILCATVCKQESFIVDVGKAFEQAIPCLFLTSSALGPGTMCHAGF